jgi:hypothetical protein
MELRAGKEITMATIEGTLEFYTDMTKLTGHDLRVKVDQEFEIQTDGSLKDSRGPAFVQIFAGPMLLWDGAPEEMKGWLGERVKAEIETADWGISQEAIREAVAEERDAEETYLSLMGRI